MAFWDRVNVDVKAGYGGNGLASLHREKFVQKGGPDGGDGGPGGSVYVRAVSTRHDLREYQLRHNYRAANGGNGGKNKRHGASGPDVFLEAPRGTTVYDAVSGNVLADLVEEGQTVRVARGGRGGLGNTHFATPSHQAPRLAERGEPGQERRLRLELKLIGDVGLVGAPNAGKSSLLRAISAADPEVGAYPFTTLEPNLGVVEVEAQRFVVADIPGLIEGASEGRGLGHQFLRHIVRTRVLIHVLDGAAADPLKDFIDVSDELVAYSPDLAERPRLVAVNKMDLKEARARWAELHHNLSERGEEAVAISTVTEEGLDALVRRTAELLLSAPAPKPSLAEIPVYTAPPDENAFTVRREDGAYRVEGVRIQRVVAMTDFTNDEALARLQRILGAMGITAALEAEGIQEGDTVLIGEAELEWTP